MRNNRKSHITYLTTFKSRLKNQGRKCPSVKVKGRQREYGSKLNLNTVKAEHVIPTQIQLLHTDLVQKQTRNYLSSTSAVLSLCLTEQSFENAGSFRAYIGTAPPNR